mgnify:CR=1 FL=1
MTKKLMRSLVPAMALTLAVGMFTGCSGGSGESSADTSAGDSSGESVSSDTGSTAKDTLIIATANETPSVTTNEHNAVAGGYMNILTYEGLLRRGMDMKPEPCLAESYKAISDTEWEFKIRKGVKFHTGEEMTVEDVKASLDWAQNFPLIKTSTENIKQVDIVDDETIKITTFEPCAIILDNLTGTSNAIVPKKLIDEGNNFNENPIGTGPYVFKEWKMGDSLTFEAFKDYWEGEPKIKNMIWKIIPEGSSRTIALEAGEIDFIVEVEAMDYDRLAGNDEVAIYEYDATEHNWMMLNNEKPGLDNVNVRKAMDCAIDKESVIAVALNGRGTAIYSQAPNNMPGASEENVNSFDIEQAKKYMDESGVDPASIEMSIICSNDTKKRAAEVIQANLKDTLGINTTIESMDLATYMSVTAEGNYTASIGNFTSSDMISFLFGVFHSKSIDGSNKTRLNNSEVDALIDKASATIDATERDKVLQECISLINTLTPQVPLYQPVNFRAYNANLQGVEVSPSGTLYFEDVSWK